MPIRRKAAKPGEVMVRSEHTTEPATEQLESIEVIGVPKKTFADKKPIDPVLRAKAFEMYMCHHTYDEICKETGIKKGTLLSWSGKEHWGAKRKENDATTLGDIMETKKYRLDNIVMKILEGLEKAVDRDARGGFNAKAVPTYFAALGSIEKLSRLNRGLATSISEERTKRAQFTLPLEHLKQITEVKIADPFQSYSEGEVSSVEEPSEAGRTDSEETT